jgi:hypothetical protein
VSAGEHQREILLFLRRRLDADYTQRFCTLKTIATALGLARATQYLRTIVDDLEIAGLINTRQAYQASGQRLVQISAKGIDLVDEGNGVRDIESAKWTGRYEVGPIAKEKILDSLRELRLQIEGSDLPNAQKANALAVVKSCELLAEAPDPAWPMIVRLLRSPPVVSAANAATLIGFVLAILTMIANG